MKKKVFATLLAVSMIASMVPAAVSVQAADGDSIRLVNGKIEVDAQLKKLAPLSKVSTGGKGDSGRSKQSCTCLWRNRYCTEIYRPRRRMPYL